jgi:hypothetical protein
LQSVITRVSALVRWGTGADEGVLARMPAERTRFTTLGAVILLSTAMQTMAVCAPLVVVLGQPPGPVITIGVMSAALILAIDRWTLSGVESRRRKAALRFLPRLLLAVLLSLLVVKPVTALVFHPAVVAQVSRDRQATTGSELDHRTAELELAVGQSAQTYARFTALAERECAGTPASPKPSPDPDCRHRQGDAARAAEELETARRSLALLSSLRVAAARMQPVELLEALRAVDELSAHGRHVSTAQWLLGLLFLLVSMLPAMTRLGRSGGYAAMVALSESYDQALAERELAAGRLPEPATVGWAGDSPGGSATLVNYDGWVGVELLNGDRTARIGDDRHVLLDATRSVELSVVIAGEVSEKLVREPLVVTDGAELPTVDFLVELDSDRPELRRAGTPVSVSHGDQGRVHFDLSMSTTGYEQPPWVWVRVSQGRRTLQNIELSLNHSFVAVPH